MVTLTGLYGHSLCVTMCNCHLQPHRNIGFYRAFQHIALNQATSKPANVRANCVA